MRIIGGRDYYDGAGLGVDPAITFLRQERLLDVASPFPIPRRVSFSSETGDCAFVPCLAVVAGEAWPFFGIAPRLEENLLRNGGCDPFPVMNWIHDAQEAMALFRQHLKEGRLHSLWPRTPQTQEARIRDFFALRGRSAADWALDHRVVTALILRIGDDLSRGRREPRYRIRADGAFLHEVAFWKSLDPATIHMRISAFVGGVLPQTRETLEIGNADRIAKAGFDVKTSFRRDAPVKARKQR